MKKLIILFVVIFCVCGCSGNTNKMDTGVKNISTETVFSEIYNKDTYIIDVREEYEYAAGHIENSYNVPYSNFSLISEMGFSFDSKIIVYCQSGNRSGMAANQLLEMGYTNVYDMGGINSWNYELVKE